MDLRKLKDHLLIAIDACDKETIKEEGNLIIVYSVTAKGKKVELKRETIIFQEKINYIDEEIAKREAEIANLETEKQTLSVSTK